MGIVNDVVNWLKNDLDPKYGGSRSGKSISDWLEDVKELMTSKGFEKERIKDEASDILEKAMDIFNEIFKK